MSSPTWKTKTKEGFKEGAKDKDQVCIQTGSGCKNSPSPSPSPIEIPPSFYQQLSKLSENFNLTDAKKLYTDFITSIKTGADGINDIIAILISGLTPDPTNGDRGILSTQVAMWFAVVGSYFFVINWWYVLCYTNYTIDFRDYIVPTIHWPMAPPLYALELFNYYALTMRMDSESKISIDFFRNIWYWRPVVFSVFHGIVFSFMVVFSATDVVMNSMINAGILSGAMFVFSICYFFTLLIREKWYKKFIDSGSSLVVLGGIGLGVLSFIGMFMFISIICPIITLYLLFLSYFVLFAFNNFWPPSVLSICNQIFQELKEAPVDSDNPPDKWGKLKNAIFQNTYSLYLLYMVCTIIIVHLIEAMTFSSHSLIVIAFIINFGLAFLFAPSAFTVIFELLGILLETDLTKIGGDENAAPLVAESDI